jgi:chemotaxis response regulator CheB
MVKQREIRILSVDDHPLFREALPTVIASQSDMILVAEAAPRRCRSFENIGLISH